MIACGIDMADSKGPTDAQINAAIEGAKDMPEARRGGPRRASAEVEPDEFVKRETAVFKPGTHGRKPESDDRPTSGHTPGSAEGERDPSEQSR